MMSEGPKEKNQLYDDINITPMLDLAYVLLVTFIILTTAAVQGVRVQSPLTQAANNLGTLLGQEGHDGEAEACFRSALSANPRSVQAWVNLAATLASESRFPEARTAIESALQVSPQNADALRLQQMLPSVPDEGPPASGPIAPHSASATRGPD